MDHYIQILDYWTQIAINAIWKEQVRECIQRDIETGNVQFPYQEYIQPTYNDSFWGIVVNK